MHVRRQEQLGIPGIQAETGTGKGKLMTARANRFKTSGVDTLESLLGSAGDSPFPTNKSRLHSVYLLLLYEVHSSALCLINTSADNFF